MMDAIASIASSLSSATVLTKALLGMKVDQEVITKVSALQSEIMTAQSAALTGLAERASLLQTIDDLENKLRVKESWESECERYQLTEFPTGAQAYVLRDEQANGEPAHRLCPHCFQSQRKSIFQSTVRVRGGDVAECPACKLRLVLIKSGPLPPITNYSGRF